MAPDSRRRRRTVQPELPLPAPEAVPRSVPTADPVVADWRIDDHTRTVGLLGIAAARARLSATGARVAERAKALEYSSTTRAA